MTYSTKEIADLTGVHVNTVRFYEEIGFITAPKRKQNGYRVFTDLQLEQCKLIRLAMRVEVMQHGLRDKAVEIVKDCALLKIDQALMAADDYKEMIEHEIQFVREASSFVEELLHKKTCNSEENQDYRYGEYDQYKNRKMAAIALHVTTETLRTWERSGLIEIHRENNGYRVYSRKDMERLTIIRTLRCANYSISAILRLMGKLDGMADATISVEDVLNSPEEHEDIISVCDRLAISLKDAASDANKIVKEIKVIEKIVKDVIGE